MRTYLLIGCIMAVIACIVDLCAIYCVRKSGRFYTTHGYNQLIGGVLIAWFFWPIWIAWSIYVLVLKLTDIDKLIELEDDLANEMTEEES